MNNAIQNSAASLQLKPAEADSGVQSTHVRKSYLSRAFGLAGKLTKYCSELGVATGLRWYSAKMMARVGFPGVKLLRIKAPNLAHPVVVRMYPSSDDSVFDQIFVEHEYGTLCDAVKDARFIFDLGANVGYASALFATRYPSAQIVAVEPDPGNYQQCSENVKPYGARIRTLLGAVWARRSRLALVHGVGCDGREWATQVAETPDNGQVEAWDMPTLLDFAGQPSIDILKIDIEGSEAEVFAAANTAEWLPRVKNICIELHNEACREIFFNALRGFTYDLQNHGEFTLCLNLKPNSLIL